MILSVVVALIGNNRKIGAAAAFFASVFLSPLIGLILVLASKRNDQEAYEQKMLETASQGKVSTADELLKLKSLLDSGVITPEEFEQQKAKLLEQ